MIGRGPDGFGLYHHSQMHRREFKERFGRKPKDYDEIVEKLEADTSHRQSGLATYSDD